MRNRRRRLSDKTGLLCRKRTGLLAAAVLCIVFGALLGCTPDEPGLVVNEIVSSNKLSYTDETLGSPDWIELCNLSSREIDLAGLILTDKDDKYELGNILPSIRVPAGGCVVLPARANADTDDFCLPFGLSKDGDILCLLNASGGLMERIVIPPLPQDVSYARREDGSFGYCIMPTPGGKNTEEISDTCPEISEPEEPVPEQQPPEKSETVLYFNEIVSNGLPFGEFDGADWIELCNPGARAVSLEGFFLSDREDKADKAALPAVSIPPRGYLAIPFGPEEGMIDMGISSAGESLYLYDASLALVDGLSVPKLLDGQSWAKNSNGIFGYCGDPTPGLKNRDSMIGIKPTLRADASEPLRLNEVLFRNTYSVIDCYGDHADFVELYNSGDRAVSLEEYCLSDEFDQPLKWRCPDLTLEPGGYLLIFLTGKESVEGEIHAPFSVSASDDGLQLYHRTTRTTQQIPWSDEVPKNTSAGLDANGKILYYKYPTPGAANAAAADDVKLLSAFPADGVHISEVSAIGGKGDWVELKNGSSGTVDLNKWYLTDSPDAKNKCVLSGSVKSGGFALFYPKKFHIAATGETLFLYDGEGRLHDVFDTGDLSEGITSGRTDDGSAARVFFLSATPKKANTAKQAAGRTSAPVISDLSLYHDAPFRLRIDCADPDAVIRYTLDGTEPTGKSAIYKEPITVRKTVVVRAFAQKKGYLPSRTVMATYLFRTPHTLPVVSIACDPEQFKAFTKINKISDRYPSTDAQITFYEPDGTIGTAFSAEMNPRGNQSIKYPQKSLSLHLRARLGQGAVNYPFWGDGTALDYETLILRNGSQDYTRARLRDSFALKAVENLQLDSARTRPVVVYVNRSYYGIMDLNEGMNQDYLVTHYGVDPAKISHISTNATVRYGTAKEFLRIREYARKKSFKNDSVLKEFSKWVDTDYIIDYLIAQTFFCNYDIKNQSYWATSDYSVRWRPVFYDIDRCFTDGSSSRNLFNWYFDRKGVVYDAKAGRVVNMDLYAALRDNPGWCDRFVHRYAELLCTDFSVKRLQTLLDRTADELRPEMERHIAKFHAPDSMQDWEKYVKSMRKEISKRHKIIQDQICSEFRLKRADWDAMMADAKKKAAAKP